MKKAVLGVVLLASTLALTARADDAAKPRAAVVVTVAEGIDGFVEAYLFEVAASILRSDDYEVAPPHATRAQLAGVGQTAGACSNDEACVASLARRLGAPTLLFIEASAIEGESEEISVVIRGATVQTEGVSLSTPAEEQGSETAMGQPVQFQAERLTDTTPPCHLVVEANGIPVSVQVDSGAPITEFPIFVEPGSHSIVVKAERRADYQGRFTCEAGRRYRVGVR
jgi:hypothetical protein